MNASHAYDEVSMHKRVLVTKILHRVQSSAQVIRYNMKTKGINDVRRSLYGKLYNILQIKHNDQLDSSSSSSLSALSSSLSNYP
jgi:hypothetical protein